MQKNTKKFLVPFLLLGFLFTSSSSSAAALTASQAEAISALMRSFGADEAVVKNVQLSLDGSVVSIAAQSASRAALPTNKKTVSPNQDNIGDIDPSPEDSPCVALTTNLRYRSRDAQTSGQISLLQDFLQSRGFLNSEPTGYFGLLSLKAVKDFQKSVGIEPTGFVGALTRAKIKELSCGNSVPLPKPEKYGCYPEYTGGPVVCVDPPAPRPSNLEVLSPNGGESWQKGTTQTIRWAQISVYTSPGFPAETSAVSGNTSTSVMPPISPNTVNIFLISDTPPCTVGLCPAMPSVIYEIASKAPNTGEYRWTIGATAYGDSVIPDGAYVMQVCAESACDLSNSYFKIFSQSGGNLPPVIDGVSGPTVLDVGQLGTWSVRAHDPENGNLSYSVDWGDGSGGGGGGVGTSPMSISASQTTTFTHNYSRAGTYKVGFTVTDSKGLSAQSTISVNVGATQPTVTVLSPNGGETWMKGTTQMIKWQDSTTSQCPVGELCGQNSIVLKTYDIKLAIYYPPCSGPVCPAYAYRDPYQIAKGVSGSSYEWSVGKNSDTYPNTAPDGSYTIQVCQTGTATCDSSNSYFKIISGTPTNNGSPTIIGLPAIPSNIQPGQTVNFSWSATDPDNDDLAWSVDWGDSGGGGSCSSVRRQTGTGWTFSTSHAWAQAGTYQVKATVSDCVGGSDSNSFSVQVGNTIYPSITVLSPNGGESFLRGGNPISVNWTMNYTPAQNLILYLVKMKDISTSWYGTAYSKNITGKTGENSTTIDANAVPLGGQYEVQICDGNKTTASGSYLCDISNNPFTVSENPSIIIPAIKVDYPNGGDSLVDGTNYTIKWIISRIPSSAVINIYLAEETGGQNRLTIAESLPAGTTQYTWKAIYTGSKHRILARAVWKYDPNDTMDWGKAEDYGDSSFTITAPNPSITVVSPNGGENWQKGTTQNITWNNSTGGPVNISLSNYLSCWEAQPACGAPAVLYPIASNVSGLSYNWTIGSTIPAGQYKVTVSSVGSSGIEDMSNAPFTISETVLTPSITLTKPNSGLYSVGSSLSFGAETTSKKGGKFEFYLTKINTSDWRSFPYYFLQGQGVSYTTPVAMAGGGVAVPSTWTPGSYYVLATWASSDGTEQAIDFSDSTIAISGSTAAIQVLSPNGGEVWEIDHTYPVKYETANMTGQVLNGRFEYYDPQTNSAFSSGQLSLSNSAPVASDSFTVPQTSFSGNTFKVRIENGSANDSSNQYFTVLYPPTPFTDSQIIANLEKTIRLRQTTVLTPPEKYNANLDLNNDGKVTISDFIIRNVLTLSDIDFDRVYKKIMALVDSRMGTPSLYSVNFDELDTNRNGGIDSDDRARISKAMIGTRIYP